ncbi:MAG: MBL fold metallo-hydrolase, partial [Gammaproteobacteria bacterium]|nr:MBL fold metallo-hydrolase [Gammaproteobacteria bacterium]
DWYGCATFRMRTQGMTIFLDAYIDRVPKAAGTGLTADDIGECDWMVVGHSHFDHLWGAERIAKRTGCTVLGSYETVRILVEEGVPENQLMPVAGGETVDLGSGVKVRVYPSQHSCVWSHGKMSGAGEVCIGDLGVTHQERLASMRRLTELFGGMDDDVKRHLELSNQGTRGDGGALVYVFETPEGSVFYQDTSGHWTGILHNLRPDVAIIGAAGRGNIDGEPIQGSLAQFVGRQADLLRPRTLILGHHDDWLPGFSIDTDTAPIAEELRRVAPYTSLLEMGYLEAVSIFSDSA